MVAAAVCMAAAAQSKPVLKFGEDGKFKILQLTDIHYKYGKNGSKRALECINNVLDAENPDFVIITGDLVYDNEVESAIKDITGPMVERGIPFSTVFGNHDEQFDMTPTQIYDMIQKMPLSVMPARPEPVASPDYTVEIWSADGGRVANVLYCVDSHSVTRLPQAGKYDWIHPAQIAWYIDQSTMYTDDNNGTVVPSLLFMHIPLPEYKYAAEDKKNILTGKKGEKVCCPELNSGMFAAMRGQGDVFAVFCGHDHDNDFAAAYRKILLAYGRYSGGDTVYNHLKPSGARVIELTESAPGTLKTWLRLADGTLTDTLTFPAE